MKRRSRHTTNAWLIVPPIMSVLKDVVAAIALLSTEPGITAKAKFYYSLSLLPGVLFVEDALPALFVNVLFWALVGLILYTCIAFKRAWLLVIPPAIFLFKDVIAMTTVMLSSRGGITPQATRYYSVAMLPGSVVHKLVNPTLFNVAFGALTGVLLYLLATRRNAVGLP